MSAPSTSAAGEHAAAAGEALDKVEMFQKFLKGHVLDSHDWHLPFTHGVHLPPFLTVHGVMLLIGSILLLVIFGVVYRKKDDVPTGFTNLLEALIVFVRDEIAIVNLGEKDGKAFTPFFCTMFFFILMLNLLGLIPLFSTATSNPFVTAALAVVILLGLVGMGIIRNGPLQYLKSFAPPGVPWPVLIILVPIEIMGVFIKAFALMIRLCANMLAGHIVLFSLLGMIILFGGFVAPPVMLMAVAIYMLEIFVAFLQAYIFVFLSALFIGAALHPQH